MQWLAGMVAMCLTAAMLMSPASAAASEWLVEDDVVGFPPGAGFDREDNLYYYSNLFWELRVRSPAGELLTSIPPTAPPFSGTNFDPELMEVYDLAVTPDGRVHLLVTNGGGMSTTAVKVVGLAADHQSSLGWEIDYADLSHVFPSQIAADAAGNIFVLENQYYVYNGQPTDTIFAVVVKKFDPDGTMLWSRTIDFLESFGLKLAHQEFFPLLYSNHEGSVLHVASEGAFPLPDDGRSPRNILVVGVDGDNGAILHQTSLGSKGDPAIGVVDELTVLMGFGSSPTNGAVAPDGSLLLQGVDERTVNGVFWESVIQPYWVFLTKEGVVRWERKVDDSLPATFPDIDPTLYYSFAFDDLGMLYLGYGGDHGVSDTPLSSTGGFLAKYDLTPETGGRQWLAPVGSSLVDEIFLRIESAIAVVAPNGDAYVGQGIYSDSSWNWNRFIERNPQGVQTFMSLTPSESRKVPDEQQTLEALVMHNGLPAAGVTVDFTVGSGPNAGAGGSAITDDTGTAEFTFGGTPEVGIDIVEATAMVDDNELTATAQVEWKRRQIDLTVVKAGLYGDSSINETTKVKIGESLSFTLLISNNGPDTATAVRVEDSWPAELEYQSSSASQGSCSFDLLIGLSCDLGELASGASASVTIIGKAITGGTVGNGAMVINSVPEQQEDTNNLNNESVVGFTVERRQIDLTVVKAGLYGDSSINETTKVKIGESLSFTLLISNNGPDTATAVRVEDSWPAELEYQSSSASQGSCSFDLLIGLSCDLGELASGASASVTIIGKAITGGTVGNGAMVINSVPEQQEDTNNLNNESVVGFTVERRQIDLTVVKAGLYGDSSINETTKVKIGESLSFTLLVSNNGSDTAKGVQVDDSWPAELEYLSSSASQGSCSFDLLIGLTCDLGELASGASASVTIIGKAITGGTVGNGAMVINSVPEQQEDTNNLNNESVVGFTVERRQIDLTVVKAGLYGDSSINETTKVKIGESLSFTLLVSNNGPDTAKGVQVDDSWPVELEYLSSSASQGSCSFDLLIGLTCDLGELVSGASASVTIIGKAITGGTVGNGAMVINSVPEQQEDTNNLNNESAVGFTVERRKVDISMTMTTSLAEDAEPVSGNTPVFPGEMVRFLVRVQNTGPDTADGVTIRDTLGEGFAYESSYSPTVTCNYDAGQRILTCGVGSLVPVQDGGDAPWVSVTARAVSAGTRINEATIDFDAATHEDTQPANNSVSVALKILEKIKGDFNADGEVTVLDAIQGLKIVTGVGLEGGREAAFDATCDGRVDLRDVNLILGVIAGTREPPTSCP